jgi:hypothetical protein
MVPSFRTQNVRESAIYMNGQIVRESDTLKRQVLEGSINYATLRRRPEPRPIGGLRQN